MKRLLFLCLGLVIAAGANADINTRFTYQGIVRGPDGPITGDVSFQFQLFDAAEDGSQVGLGLGIADRPIVNGQVSEVLDFGAAAFNGEPRWLEISFDGDGGVDNFVTLSPRVRIHATPYAIYAQYAENVDDADADPVNELVQEFKLEGTTLSITEANQIAIVDLSTLESEFGNPSALDASDGSPSGVVSVDESGNTKLSKTVHLLDPFNTSTTTTSSDHLYQSFTVEHDGFLEAVGVAVDDGSALGRISIIAGAAVGPLISQSNTGPFETEGDYTVARFPQPLPVQVGEVYTIRSSRASGNSSVTLLADATNPYAGGQQLFVSGRDIRFQVYISSGGTLEVEGGANFSESVTAAHFIGDGSLLTNVDPSSTNELQNLSILISGSDRELQISNGTNVTFSVADNDNNSTNELQGLSSVLTLSNDAGGASLANVGTISATGLAVDSPTLSVDAANDRVGIGTTSPDAALEVQGDIYFGSSGQYSPIAVPNAAPTQMLYGRIASDGTVKSGSGGFSVTIDEEGNNLFIIDFDPDFSVAPTVVTTSEDDNRIATIRSLNTDFVRIRTGRIDDNNGDPAAFSFMVIGPR